MTQQTAQQPARQADQDPANALRTMLFGYFPAQAVHVAARLGLADHLADGPRPAADLAEATGCDPGTLPRLLRALAGLGVLEQPQPGTFALTEMGEVLRTGHPASLRNYAMLFCGEPVWRCWGDLEHSVRTGQSAWERNYGPQFSSEGVEPEFSAIFNGAMAEGTGRAAPALIEYGGFARFGTVVDFFRSVPGGADAYLLKSVIHDWDDERATAILAACQAMPQTATLLLAEPVASVQPRPGEQFAVSYSDLNMLVCASGRERTEQEFRSLLDAAGFALQRITPCPPTGYRILAATPRP